MTMPIVPPTILVWKTKDVDGKEAVIKLDPKYAVPHPKNDNFRDGYFSICVDAKEITRIVE